MVEKLFSGGIDFLGVFGNVRRSSVRDESRRFSLRRYLCVRATDWATDTRRIKKRTKNSPLHEKWAYTALAENEDEMKTATGFSIAGGGNGDAVFRNWSSAQFGDLYSSVGYSSFVNGLLE